MSSNRSSGHRYVAFTAWVVYQSLRSEQQRVQVLSIRMLRNEERKCALVAWNIFATHSPRSYHFNECLHNLGILTIYHENSTAECYFRTGNHLCEQHFPHTIELPHNYNNLAKCCGNTNRWKQAEALFLKAYEHYIPYLHETDNFAHCVLELADRYISTNRPNEALELHNKTD